MITAIIIDDEQSSRNALRQKLSNHCPEVMIIAECENGELGIENIEAQKPDIIFLDVEMPRMNGFTMLQQIKNKNFDGITIKFFYGQDNKSCTDEDKKYFFFSFSMMKLFYL